MHNTTFQWAVIGAGPAGIAAIGKLLDYGVLAEHILWFDPYFKVGDFGLLWRNVSSNTKVEYFKEFLLSTQSFLYQNAPVDFALNHLPLNETCTLAYMVEPLQWITDQLLQRVHAVRDTVNNIFLAERQWSVISESETYHAKNVILATGASPSTLSYSDIHEIPFNKAIDKEKLAAAIQPNETYAVFGSSHSAIIILKHLVELRVKKIINFYRAPCRYAVELDDCILFDNTGLKGQSAVWAREHIDGVLPTNLMRYKANESNIARFLPECDHVIYAIGFERRQSIKISNDEFIYNPHVGIIGPGLFGLGIAYPEIKTDPYGNVESQVGLWKFMLFLNKIMPIWLRYPA